MIGCAGMLKAIVTVKLKKTVLDPQGKTVHSAISSLGFDSIKEVRMGKSIELLINGEDKEKAGKDIDEMCKKLLSNPIIEDYSYTLEEV